MVRSPYRYLQSSFTSRSGQTSGNADIEVLAKLEMEPKARSELQKIFSSMPPQEKYSILIQSLTNGILEEHSKSSKLKSLQTISNLYTEMIRNKIAPQLDIAKSYINAATSVKDTVVVATALRLIKAGTG